MLVALILAGVAFIAVVVLAIASLRQPKFRKPSDPEPGVVVIPAADGYHYGDDHPWGPEQQHQLTVRLLDLERQTRGEPQDKTPDEDSR